MVLLNNTKRRAVMNYYLGVDVGTSSVKSLLMDSGGKTVGTSQIGYDIIKEKLQ